MNGPQVELIDFSQLFDLHAPHVHRFAVFLSGDPSVADDVVSETFIRLWNARARVDLTTVRSYLLAIARNLVIEERRRGRRLVPVDDFAIDTRPGPERRTTAEIELQSVLAALQALPEVDRAAVLMRAEEGLSYAEIASILGMTPVTARVKVHRARLKLAEAREPNAAAAPGRKSAT